MTLILEIEHLLGVAFAAQGQASDAPDWPPQPDRVFSALVAAWGARGEQGAERRALEWLEAQQAPLVLASAAEPRTAHTAYVPPNDYRIPSGPLNAVKWYRDFLSNGITPPEKGGHRKAWLEAWNVMPEHRKRSGLKDRKFPAARPHDPIVRLVWPEAMPDPNTLAALSALAADTAYIGHSASLTRCRFHDGEPPSEGVPPQRRVYRGRLAELEQGFHARPLQRPRPGAPVRGTRSATRDVRTGVFSDRWLVLEHVAGEMPDIRAAALVAKALRNAIMSGYRQIDLGDVIPAEISGHSPDGRPSSAPHLAIAPLAFIGRQHASGAALGFALIPPRDRVIFADRDFQRALGAITRWNPEEGRRELLLAGQGLDLTFATAGESPRQSLDPGPYIAEARIWASCTPIILDRYLKETANEAREREIERLLRQACINTGLPEPCRVAAGKHSALEGSPSAFPSGPAPRWLRWRVPDSLGSRQLVHAVIEFAEPLCGPVILGAGRFVGLGLFRAFRPTEAGS
jgi:CRISPR-associated protein Csb2